MNPVTGEITYTPDPGFTGIDTFIYEVCDIVGLCDTATVTITVIPNLPPVANNDSDTTDINTPVTTDVLINDFDTDGTLDPTSVTVTSPPANGGTSVNPVTGEIEYTPDLGFIGVDTYQYEVCDDDDGCDTATVTITVGLVNLPPIANDDVDTTTENDPVTTDVLVNDFDPEASLDLTSVTVISGPGNGGTSVNPVTGEVTYTPDPGYTGIDTYVYEVCDTPGLCDTATVTITVIPNLPPVANNDNDTTDIDTPVTTDVLANDFDTDGTLDPSTVTVTSPPANGGTSVNPVTGENRVHT